MSPDAEVEGPALTEESAELLEHAKRELGDAIVADAVVLGDAAIRIRPDAWPTPPIFAAIQRAAAVDDAEMRRTFNMGLGFLLVVSPDDVAEATRRLQVAGERVYAVGEIVAGEPGVDYA